jgi:hypothetical protein
LTLAGNTPTKKAAAYARLPVQVPLVLWARGVAKGSEGRS